jgi:glutamate/tyrosine decarboxylase-like PLP-dependent enzyme
LSRRARGFAAWAMLRTLGREGVVDMVRRPCALASRLADSLRKVHGVEILNDVRLNQLVVGFGPGEAPAKQAELARATIDELQRENICFAGGALWKGRWVLRIPIIAWPLQEEDIDRLADAIARAWRNATKRLEQNEGIAQ